MTPAERSALRKSLDLTQAALGALFGVSRATIIRAEADDEISPYLSALYRMLDRFRGDAVDVLQTGSDATA